MRKALIAPSPHTLRVPYTRGCSAATSAAWQASSMSTASKGRDSLHKGGGGEYRHGRVGAGHHKAEAVCQAKLNELASFETGATASHDLGLDLAPQPNSPGAGVVLENEQVLSWPS